jgi:hypothetical protein
MDNARLKKHFHFTDADLSANRNGRLSEPQKKRLMDEARAERKSARESATIVFVIAALGLTFGLIITVNAAVVSAKILVGLALCVLWPLGWGGGGWTILRSAPPERAGQVRWARGGVRVIRQGEDVMLDVGGRQFDVEGDPAGALTEGEEVAVYYLDDTEEILSVERLTNA